MDLTLNGKKWFVNLMRNSRGTAVSIKTQPDVDFASGGKHKIFVPNKFIN